MAQKSNNAIQAQRLLEWAVFLDVILLTVDFCLRENKINEIKTIKVYLKKIHDSFTEEQWIRFKEELRSTLGKKFQMLDKETRTEYDTDTTNKLITDLLSQFV